MDANILNQTQMSVELKHILLHRSGYRTDDQSELADTIGNYPTNIEILSQEIIDLENTDIIDTLYNLYNCKILNHKEADEDDLKLIDQFIKQKLNTKHYHLIWLCDTAYNASRYSNIDGNTKSVYCVNLKQRNLMPISDLGPEGVLIAYK